MSDLSDLLRPLVDSVGPGPSPDDLSRRVQQRRRRRRATRAGAVVAAAAAVIGTGVTLAVHLGGDRAGVVVSVGGGKPGVTAVTGTTPATATPSPTTAPVSTAPPVSTALSACRHDQLALHQGPGSAATGHVEIPVVVDNTASAPCRLQGVPALQMLDAAGKPLPTDVLHGSSFFYWTSLPATVVTIPTGGHATFDLGYANATGYGGAQCPTAAKVQITLPGVDAPFLESWSLQPYGGATIQQLHCGEIAVSPVLDQAGSTGG